MVNHLMSPLRILLDGKEYAKHFSPRIVVRFKTVRDSQMTVRWSLMNQIKFLPDFPVVDRTSLSTLFVETDTNLVLALLAAELRGWKHKIFGELFLQQLIKNTTSNMGVAGIIVMRGVEDTKLLFLPTNDPRHLSQLGNAADFRSRKFSVISDVGSSDSRTKRRCR